MDANTPTDFNLNPWGLKTSKFTEDAAFIRSVKHASAASVSSENKEVQLSDQDSINGKVCSPDEYFNRNPQFRAAQLPAIWHYLSMVAS